MSDAEKPDWLSRYDDAEWTIQTVHNYLNDMGHEVRTPLTALSLEAQIIKRWLVLAKQGDMSFEKLNDLVERLCASTDLVISTFNTLTHYAVQRSADDTSPEKPAD